MKRFLGITVVCGAAMLAQLANADIQVVVSEIVGDPTSVAPGARLPDGTPTAASVTAILKLTVSDDGNRWFLRGFTDLDADYRDYLLLGSGGVATMLAQEGQPIPTGAPGELYDFFTDSQDIHTDGRYVFGARAKGGVSGVAQKIMFFDGTDLTIRFQQGGLITNLLDRAPNPSGDETFGNSVGSSHILDDGRIGLQDPTIGNISTFNRPALMYDNVGFRQSGISPVSSEIWDSMSTNQFDTTPDGTTWAAIGDTENTNTNLDAILAVNDQIVLQEGTTVLAGSAQGSFTDDTFAFKLLPNGSWLARGDYENNADFAVRDGVLIAETGQPITTGAGENWGDAFTLFTGNVAGHYVILGNTNNADTLLDSVGVIDGDRVFVREGDAIDLNGDGVFNDDTYLRGFTAFGGSLSAGQVFMFTATLKDAAETNLGDALLRIRLSCDGDVDGNGAVDLSDLASLLAAFGSSASPDGFNVDADFNLDNSVDLTDLATLLSAFGSNCP